MEEEIVTPDAAIPKELPVIEPTPLVPVQKKNNSFAFVCIGIAIGVILTIAFIHAEISPQYLKDQTCDSLNNQSFINGTYYGSQMTMFSILNYTAQCQEPLPIEFNDETYNLFLVECLNLNNQGGK